MSNQQSGVPEIDLLAIRDALKLRWWIVPVVMLVSVGFLFINESNLATEPGYVRVSRTYEALDESSVLRIVGLEPQSVVPYPSFDNQLRLLQAPETRAEILNSVNSDVEVAITRTDQRFLVVESQERSVENQFLLRREGTPLYEFSCTAPSSDVCVTAIEAYATKLTDLRRASIESGFARAEKILENLIQADPASASQVDIKLKAIRYAKTLVTGDLAMITSTNQSTGPTVSTVKISTYLFGLSVGALIGLLIILQLTLTDRKIRTERKLVKTIGADMFLGATGNGQLHGAGQQIAAAIAFRASETKSSILRILPIDSSTDFEELKAVLVDALNQSPLKIYWLRVIDDLSATEILPPTNSVMVLIAKARTSNTDTLLKVLTATERAGNTVAGVILSM